MSIDLEARRAGGARRSGRGRLGGAEVAALVRAAEAGDSRSWDELVAEFSGMIWAVARAHRLGDADAKDVSQATWLRLLEHLGRINDRAAIGAWLATTARRESLRIVRGGERVAPYGDELPDPPSTEPAPDHRLAVAARDRVLWGAFALLSDSDQALLRMVVADPRPGYDEISAALGMRCGSIGPTRARALARLRRRLDDEQSLLLMSA